MNSSIICDYVTVFICDAYENGLSDFANGVCVWDIPESAYYFKDRGSVCLMSIVDATLPQDIGEDIVVMTQQGRNGFTTQENSAAADIINADLAVLGSFTNSTNESGAYFSKFNTPQLIKLQTSAKPRRIRLVLFTDDKDTKDISSAALRKEGHFTIKFEYIDPEVNQKTNYSVEYKPAFPDIKSF